MPVKLERVRMPRSHIRMHQAVMDEIRNAYNKLALDTVTIAYQDVKAWDDKPTFKSTVTVSKRRWTLKLSYDGRTTGGKHYKWIDRGTASYSVDNPGKPYPIAAKIPLGRITYTLPTPMPKTSAADGTLAHSYTDPPGVVIANVVMHPGIKPRLFMQEYIEHLNSHKSGSFRNVTEAAIKRGLRKI